MKLLIVLFLALQSLTPNLNHGTVNITVSGVKSEKGGQLSAAIFTKATFLKNEEALMQKVVPVDKSTMQISFEKVPPGTYAIALFQDIDKNEKLNTNLIGFPNEPFGFSNNAKLKFGPPSFKDAAIQVEAGKTLELSVKLRGLF